MSSAVHVSYTMKEDRVTIYRLKMRLIGLRHFQRVFAYLRTTLYLNIKGVNRPPVAHRKFKAVRLLGLVDNDRVVSIAQIGCYCQCLIECQLKTIRTIANRPVKYVFFILYKRETLNLLFYLIIVSVRALSTDQIPKEAGQEELTAKEHRR